MVPRHVAVISGIVNEVHVCVALSSSLVTTPFPSLGLGSGDLYALFAFCCISSPCLPFTFNSRRALLFISLHTDLSSLLDTTTLNIGTLFIIFLYTIHESCIPETYLAIVEHDLFCTNHVAFLIDIWFTPLSHTDSGLQIQRLGLLGLLGDLYRPQPSQTCRL